MKNILVTATEYVYMNSIINNNYAAINIDSIVSVISYDNTIKITFKTSLCSVIVEYSICNSTLNKEQIVKILRDLNDFLEKQEVIDDDDIMTIIKNNL